MFCHKCGAKIADDAGFCHKCGTKVVHTEAEPENTPVQEMQKQAETASESKNIAENLVNVTLVSVGNRKMDVIKAVMGLLNISLAESRDIVETTPISIKKAIPLDEAENIKQIFVKLGATVSFTDQNEQPAKVIIHCRKCGAELNDESEICPSCNNPSDLTSNAADQDPKIKLPHSLSEFKVFFRGLPVYGKLLTILAICAGLLLLVVAVVLIIAIFKLIFSSAAAFFITAAVVYYIYQRWGATKVAAMAYNKKGQDLQLPEGMNSNSLLEALSGKFNYPYFKGVRYNEVGACVIEGKYSEYPVTFYENGRVKLSYINKDSKDNRRLIMREAIAIQSYINKFFDPSLPYDAADDMKALKFAEKQIKAIGLVITLASVIIVGSIVLYIISPDAIKPGAGVRNAYLSMYSEEITIEEAFDNFFGNEKWSTYKDESYEYVVFSGVCQYNEEPADIRITFKITGENFLVDSMDINGVEQNDLITALMLEKIYGDYEQGE